jgi:uncharacterized protein YjiK
MISSYSAYGKLTRIAQKNNSATDEITVVAFDYTDNYLTTMTDAAGRVYTLNYTGDLLTSISLGDTVIAEYVYNGGSQLVGIPMTIHIVIDCCLPRMALLPKP